MYKLDIQIVYNKFLNFKVFYQGVITKEGRYLAFGGRLDNY